MRRSSFGRSRKRNIDDAGALIADAGVESELRSEMVDGSDGEAMGVCVVVARKVERRTLEGLLARRAPAKPK